MKNAIVPIILALLLGVVLIAHQPPESMTIYEVNEMEHNEHIDAINQDVADAFFDGDEEKAVESTGLSQF